MNNEAKCPKCASTSLAAIKKGFSGKKAVAGAVLTGGIGLLAGTIGSNKIKVSCLNCGHQFMPGTEAAKNKKEMQRQQANENFKKHPVASTIIMVIFIGVFLLLLKACFG